jgi:hypothetical protein
VKSNDCHSNNIEFFIKKIIVRTKKILGEGKKKLCNLIKGRKGLKSDLVGHDFLSPLITMVWQVVVSSFRTDDF